jgi:hypothetical protein
VKEHARENKIGMFIFSTLSPWVKCSNCEKPVNPLVFKCEHCEYTFTEEEYEQIQNQIAKTNRLSYIAAIVFFGLLFALAFLLDKYDLISLKE